MTGASLVDLSQIDLVTDEMLADPFGYFAELTEREPMLWNEKHRAWFVSRYEDVIAGLSHQDMDANRIGPYLASKVAPANLDRFERMFDILSRWMVFLSPPDHTRLRRLLHRSFTPRRVHSLQRGVEELATELAVSLHARLESGAQSVDLVSEFCIPLPGRVIAEMFGVPIEDGTRLKGWAEELGLFINGGRSDSSRDARVAAAMVEFEAYLCELIEGYRKRPVDKILASLVSANEQDDALTEDELIATCMLLLDAGYKTVQNALANALLLLMQSPAQYDRLIADRELVATGVEECLRCLGPSKFIVRRAKRRFEFIDQQIEQGDRIYLIQAAANRDPRRFEAPQEFRVDRSDNPHLAFGHGIHFCLGAALARMEMTTALGVLLRELPRLELAVPPSELRWHRVMMLHGIESLPARLAARPGMRGP